jgi:hypothetical protein
VIGGPTARILDPSEPPGRIMKLHGQISIELEVGDFVEAAEHQRRLEALLAQVRATYPDAVLVMRERRERKAFGLPMAPPEHEASAHSAPGRA